MQMFTWVEQVFVYSVRAKRLQRQHKYCVAMVSSSALLPSNSRDICSFLAFSITPAVSGRAEKKKRKSLHKRIDYESLYTGYLAPTLRKYLTAESVT